ncbi:MAG: sulfotransferase [Nitrosomonas sp.]|nr:sulfotransferase [Nitrosomonas sp.]
MIKDQIFVIGINGSGTTMLAEALGRHPELYMFPQETRVLPYLVHRYPDSILHNLSARRALADTLGRSRAFWRCNSNQPLVLSDEVLVALNDFSSVVDAMYGHFAQLKGKQRWGDKSPMYLQHIDVLAQVFPNARFIHIYRDGRDSAQSFHRRWKQSPGRTIFRWKKAIVLGREQGKRLGVARYFELSYENLTADPENWMRRVCAFAGLDFCPVVLSSSMQYMDEGARQLAQGRMIQNSNKWRTYFNSDQIDELEEIAGKTLADLGYAVGLQGDEDLSSAQLYWLKWQDWINFSIHHITVFGVRGLVPFFFRVRDALMQDKSNKY